MSFAFSLLPTLVLFLIAPSLTYGSLLQQDCMYLSRVFYPTLHGRWWINDDYWNDFGPDSDDCCSWFGVECKTNTERRVYGLRLSSNNLTGEFPDDIDTLSGLNYLKLDGNHIHGKIPSNIDRLAYLKHISLEGSKLNGSIPDELFILALQHINFNDNDLWGEIPGTLRGSRSYNYLGFKNNHLLGQIPPFKLSDDADGCDLQGNQFTCIWPGAPSSCSGTSDLISCESLLPSNGRSFNEVLKIGIVVGVLVAVGLVIGVIWWRRKQKRKPKTSQWPGLPSSTNELLEYPMKAGEDCTVNSPDSPSGRAYPVLVTGVPYRQGRVRKDFIPVNAEQLEIRMGDSVAVNQIRPGNWVYGRNLSRHQEKEGLFPLDCVAL
ncbi:L domain-like protein [Basidiobolus meristosporus CBS 931.73]|uniref:L domain-like protein n=1 Tax=Basidiobolus meristosporus CBS 931.73 TaxID=1314790 RepID=A0A1Y1YLF9_9FUNG|nr:L domain-like protein [Basidiobolus meristosporus CBS 931.73]|eukprot:ORX98861.1 L domain-like protein [Basidiobolus meristosporus CBS 931.73]